MIKLTLLGDVNIHVRCALRHTAVTALYQTFFCQSVLLKMTPRTVGSFFSLILAIFSLSFNEVKGRSVEELEKLVTKRFLGIYDRMDLQDEEIQLLKNKDLKTTEEIKSLKQQIEESKSTFKQEIEELKSTYKQQIEEFKSISTTAKSCFQLGLQGMAIPVVEFSRKKQNLIDFCLKINIPNGNS